MTKQQIEAFKKITPGKWRFEKIQQRPFGVLVQCGEAEILRQHAVAYSSEHQTRQDCENARGITPAERRADFVKAVREQDANAEAFASLPDLLAEREKMIAALKNCFAAMQRGQFKSYVKNILAEAEGSE